MDVGSNYWLENTPLDRLFCLILIALSAAQLACPLAARAEPHPKGFSNHPFNGKNNPVTTDGVTTFTIADKQCSKVDYGDGRGESDCFNGNIRENLIYRREARLNEVVSYKFDVWVDPSIAYHGYFNDHAIGFLKNGSDSRLRIASWEGQHLHNFLYMLKVDTRSGISFLGNVCQPREKFGSWVSFEMKTLWSNSNKGWIEVTCDGKVIHTAKNLATNQNPHCYITNQCEPGKKKNATRILYILGPVMAGFGFEWKKYGMASPFTLIQPEGITVKMRNVSVTTTKK